MGMWHQQLITNQKNVVVGKPKDKSPLCRSIHGRITLKWIELNCMCRLRSSGLG